mmetsp:Transcript_13369/g.32795  ORF Transcript_13369/g.32795 Transcript_13369/m.32795 type:complete len:235 (-) Transcript_13369:206-910(-)
MASAADPEKGIEDAEELEAVDDPDTMEFCVAKNINFEDLEEGNSPTQRLHGGSESELKQMVDTDILSEPDLTINATRELFPFSIVWGPLPCLTWCIPCVGHMGIGDSQGRVHDFAGPYCVNTGRFMTGRVVRYYQLSKKEMKILREKGSPSRVWDRAIAEGDRKYQGLMHNICCQNCHHHTAECARNAGYRIGMVDAAILVLLKGRSVSLDRTLFAFGPFLLIVLLVVLLSLVH